MRASSSSALRASVGPRFCLIVLLAGAAPFAGACAGTLDDPAAFAPGGDDGGASSSPDATSICADVPTTLFANTCGTAACHSATLKTEGLDLVSPGLASRLVDVPSMEEPSVALIDPADPDQSYLLTKLRPNPPFGAQMPYLETALSASEIACVEQWILTQVPMADGGSD